MKNEALRVTVVIRTRDKESHFERLMKNLFMQTARPSEIIVVDNYSTKERLQILKESLRKSAKEYFREGIGLGLIALTDKEFSHAYSTNLGVNAAENELVCITNAHSLPISFHWLQDGLEYFQDSKVAGVSGYFLAHQEGKALESANEWVYRFGEKLILRQGWCSTVNCVIRKSLWKQYPFDENLPEIVPETGRYGLEDYDWSKEMMTRGYKIVVDPLFSVFHSHEQGVNDILRNVKRYFIYRRIQQKIRLFARPRKSYSKVLQSKASAKIVDIPV